MMRRGSGGTDDDAMMSLFAYYWEIDTATWGRGRGNDCIAVPCNEAITTYLM